MPPFPRGLVIQLHNRGLANEDIAQQMRQSSEAVQSCIADYERVIALLGKGYAVDQISSATGIPDKIALEYLSLAYRFNPHLK